MPWLSSAAAAPRAHRAPPCRARPRVLSSVLGHAPHWQRGNKVRRGREHCRAALQTCTSDLHFRFALQTCTSDFRAAIFSDFRAALQGCTSGLHFRAALHSDLHFIQTCTSDLRSREFEYRETQVLDRPSRGRSSAPREHRCPWSPGPKAEREWETIAGKEGGTPIRRASGDPPIRGTPIRRTSSDVHIPEVPWVVHGYIWEWTPGNRKVRQGST